MDVQIAMEVMYALVLKDMILVMTGSLVKVSINIKKNGI